MKLEDIRFKVNVEHPNGVPDSKRFWTVDYTRRVVRMGNRCVPFEACAFWDETPPPAGCDRPPLDGVKCPECEQDFESPSALGAHRYHKHKVEGTSRIKGEQT